MFEIVELDPQTGDEDHLIKTGRFEDLAGLAQEWITEADDEGRPWPIYRVQPAQ